MKVRETEIPGVLLVEPTVYRDERGFLLETWNEARYREHGIDVPFVQDNHAGSTAPALRGLHLQAEPSLQAKLVRAVEGEVWDVAVDVRVGSPTFGRYVGVTLSSENLRQLFIPAGFAHGYCVASERAQVEYKISAPHAPECELAIAWNDPEIAIPWPVRAPLLSERDRTAPTLAEVRDRLPRWEPAR